MQKTLIILVLLTIITIVPLGFVQAQSTTSVQELNGSLSPGQIDVYRIMDMKKGQTLNALMANSSGNLDPLLSILAADKNLAGTLEKYKEALAVLIATSPDPLIDLPALRDEYTLAWDDDSGPGYDAALKFTIPADGDYYLLAGGSLGAAGRTTAGNYRLLLGLDNPNVLDGSAKPTGAVIAVQNQSMLVSHQVQEYTGTLNNNIPSILIKLKDFNPGDTLYAYLHSTSGNLKPILMLRDYGNKPVQVSNLNGQNSSASFKYTISNGGANYTIDIIAADSDGHLTSGDFKLQVGVDAPEVLSGQGQPDSQSLLVVAIPVNVGLKLQQIVNIDQPNEIMNDVGTLRLDWIDPALAFDPDSCKCTSKVYTENDFNQFLSDVNGKWPDFTFFNQQGNRWILNRLIQVDSNGRVNYLERFSTNFQLDFDWTAYPFDRQDFYIKVDNLFSENQYVFVPLANFSEIDPMNGEDEFILTTFDTQVSTETSSRLVPTSRFTFHFAAPRHMSYYIFRLFIPILLIITVSYITFFLKDYGRRIEIATGNLLLFIAFSFSLGENYPRMGYLTFMDAIMATTFAINTLVVVLNVYFKWLEQKGEREKADRLEAPANYLYPLAYLVAFGVIAVVFLR